MEGIPASHAYEEMNQLEESLVSSKQIFRGKVVELTLDRIETASGIAADREVVRHRGSVAMVAQRADGRIALVRQYRHPIRQITLEIPAGTLEIDEPAMTCAIRELREETGYRANQIDRIAGFYPAPGYCSEYIEIWCTDLLEDPLGKDPDEEITVEWRSLAECLEAVQRADISDAKTIIGINALIHKFSGQAKRRCP